MIEHGKDAEQQLTIEVHTVDRSHELCLILEVHVGTVDPMNYANDSRFVVFCHTETVM